MSESLGVAVLILGAVALAGTVISWLWSKVSGDEWPFEEGRSSWWM